MHRHGRDVVSVEYVIRLEDEQVIRHNRRRRLRWFTPTDSMRSCAGSKQDLEGMAIGAAKRVTVMPVGWLWRETSGGAIRSPKGSCASGGSARWGEAGNDGNSDGGLCFYVAEIKPEVIVLDLNHPLAGKDLSLRCQSNRYRERRQLGAEEIAPAKKGEKLADQVRVHLRHGLNRGGFDFVVDDGATGLAQAAEDSFDHDVVTFEHPPFQDPPLSPFLRVSCKETESPVDRRDSQQAENCLRVH